MNRIVKITACIVIVAFFIASPLQTWAALPGARSATDGTELDVFLGGNYIELGINKSGSFGSIADKPGSFFGTSVRDTVGMSTDFDGFDTGNDYRMDYFMPGSPYEAWLAGYKISGSVTKGENALAVGYHQMTGSTVTDTSSGNNLSATVLTTLSSNLQIQQKVSFSVNDKFFKNEVTLKNVGSSVLDSVRYMRVFDPDNTKDRGGDFTTFNKILYTYATDSKAVVMSDTSNDDNDPLFLALGTRSPILYYSSDSRARVNIDAASDPYAAAAYDSAPAKDTSSTNDTNISITFDVGTLTAGESETVIYYTSLDDRDFSEVLEDIEADEEPEPTPVASGSATMPEGTWQDTKNTTYTFEGSLLENLYTEETLPTFVFTQARDTTNGIAKYQIILSGPNYPSKVYFDEIAPSALTNPVETNDRFTEYNKDLNRIGVRSKREEDRLPNGEYKWKIRAFSHGGGSIDSAEKIIRIGTHQAVFSNIVFPITLLQVGNLTGLNISSIHPMSPATMNISTRTPTFYGIANVNAHVKVVLKNSENEQVGEYKTNANTESRFGVNVEPALAPGVYSTHVSATNDMGDYVELPIFSIQVL